MDMRVYDNETSASLLVLEEADNSDMVLAEDAVEHVVGLLEVSALHGDRAVLHELRLYERVPAHDLSALRNLIGNRETHFSRL